ncbi:hypothetical protein D3C86_1926820 [compost metagenome]
MPVNDGRLACVVKRRMRLQVHLAVAQAKFVWLVDDPHRRADRHHVGQLQHVMVEHTETAVADAHTDTELLIRAMDQVTGGRQ